MKLLKTFVATSRSLRIENDLLAVFDRLAFPEKRGRIRCGRAATWYYSASLISCTASLVVQTVLAMNRKLINAASNAIVRVEAGRLRSKLLDYFNELGCGDPVRTVLPKRSYAAKFQLKPASEASTALFRAIRFVSCVQPCTCRARERSCCHYCSYYPAGESKL